MSGMFSIGLFVMQRETRDFTVLTSYINQQLLVSLPVCVLRSTVMLGETTMNWCLLVPPGKFVFHLSSLSVIRTTVFFVFYITWFNIYKVQVIIYSWTPKSFILSEIFKKK